MDRLAKAFMASKITHGTSLPYVIEKDGSWRFLGKLDADADVNTPVVVAWGGAKTKAAHHLKPDGSPDMRFAYNAGARIVTRGPNAGTWRVPATNS
jgi:hypothetical protein